MNLAFALFGEKDNRHELLAFRGASREAFLRISRFTDRRSAIDGSVLGFADESHYFFLKTWHDQAATRSGFRRVLALAAPLADAVHLDDLSVILSLFPTVAPTSLDNVVVQPNANVPKSQPASGTLRDRVTEMLRILIFEQVRPVLWLDDGDFVQAISFLWAAVPAGIRQNLRFRSATHPDDDVAEWDIIATTPLHSAMWRGRRIVAATHGVGPSPIVQDLVEGRGPEVSRAFQRLGIELHSFADYEIVERLRDLMDGDGGSVDDAATLIRDALILNAAESDVARMGIDALLAAVESASPDELMLLRNVDESFAASNADFRAAVAALASKLERSADSARSLAVAVLDRDGRDWWIDAVTMGFGRFFTTSWDRRKGQVAWDLLSSEPRTFTFLADAARGSSTIPESLAKYISGPAQRPPKSLLARLRRAGWYDVHAAALSLMDDRQSALLIQVRYEPKDSIVGVELLAKSAEACDLIHVAIESEDERLIQPAAAVLLRSEEVVPDLRQPVWQAIVARALDSAGDGNIAHPRLDAWLSQLSEIEYQTPATTELWRTIGRVYPQGLLRVNVPWQDVGEDTRLSVQRETATSWLLNPLETMTQLVLGFMGLAPIRQIVTSEVLRRGDPDAALTMFESNQNPDEDLFLSILSNVLELGGVARYSRVRNLILSNGWRKAAAEFADRVPISELSAELIKLLKRGQRVRLAAASDKAAELVPDSEWWEEFTRIAIELFPAGVRDHDVLERSGGSLSDVKLDGPGSEQWHLVISVIRKGGMGIDARPLLAGMLDVFPRNGDLRQLRDIGKKKGLV